MLLWWRRLLLQPMSSAARVMPATKSPGSGPSSTRNLLLPALVRSQHLDFAWRERSVRADGNIANAHAPDLGPYQLQHFTPDGFDHPAHLPIAAFPNDDFDKRIFRRIADALYDGRLRRP